MLCSFCLSAGIGFPFLIKRNDGRKPRFVRNDEFIVAADDHVQFNSFNAVFQRFDKRRNRVFGQQVRVRRDDLRSQRLAKFAECADCEE
jgi:dTDP-glucose pyrophosphorylase